MCLTTRRLCHTMRDKVKCGMNRMAKDEAKSETLSVRVKPSVKRILERWAQEEDRSVSQIIERMVLAKDKKTSRRS